MSVSGQVDDWNRHWSDYAESAQQNPAQRMRVALVRRLLDLPPGARLLDIGSGQGDLVAALTADRPDVEAVGLELSRVGVEVAAAKAPRARFLQRDLLQDGRPPAELRGWATHAVCSEVLEHVDQPVRLLQHARAYLAPGCRVVVTVPGGRMSAFDRHIGHRAHYRVATLRLLLERAGLRVETVAGAGFPFFNLYRLTVILRGERLIADVARDGDRPASPAARAVMRVFDLLFRGNLPPNRLGWQLVAMAREPAGSGSAE